MFFLATYTGGSSRKTWQEAADMCTAAGTTLPIPRSKAEVHALCALAPRLGYIWSGIIKEAQPNTYINYLDQSPAPYFKYVCTYDIYIFTYLHIYI